MNTRNSIGLRLLLFGYTTSHHYQKNFSRNDITPKFKVGEKVFVNGRKQPFELKEITFCPTDRVGYEVAYWFDEFWFPIWEYEINR